MKKRSSFRSSGRRSSLRSVRKSDYSLWSRTVVLAPDAAVDAPTTAVPVPGPDRVKAESGLLWLSKGGGLSIVIHAVSCDEALPCHGLLQMKGA
jgi:hypothetical protein